MIRSASADRAMQKVHLSDKPKEQSYILYSASEALRTAAAAAATGNCKTPRKESEIDIGWNNSHIGKCGYLTGLYSTYARILSGK